ncbi:MAG: hypothetical protein R3Y54_13185 [Eubacteriales bacterium]
MNHIYEKRIAKHNKKDIAISTVISFDDFYVSSMELIVKSEKIVYITEQEIRE